MSDTANTPGTTDCVIHFGPSSPPSENEQRAAVRAKIRAHRWHVDQHEADTKFELELSLGLTSEQVDNLWADEQ